MTNRIGGFGVDKFSSFTGRTDEEVKNKICLVKTYDQDGTTVLKSEVYFGKIKYADLSDVDKSYVDSELGKKVVTTEHNGPEKVLDSLKLHYLTEAEYKELKDGGLLKEDEYYLTDDSTGMSGGGATVEIFNTYQERDLKTPTLPDGALCLVKEHTIVDPTSKTPLVFDGVINGLVFDTSKELMVGAGVNADTNGITIAIVANSTVPEEVTNAYQLLVNYFDVGDSTTHLTEPAKVLMLAEMGLGVGGLEIVNGVTPIWSDHEFTVIADEVNGIPEFKFKVGWNVPNNYTINFDKPYNVLLTNTELTSVINLTLDELVQGGESFQNQGGSFQLNSNVWEQTNNLKRFRHVGERNKVKDCGDSIAVSSDLTPHTMVQGERVKNEIIFDDSKELIVSVNGWESATYFPFVATVLNIEKPTLDNTDMSNGLTFMALKTKTIGDKDINCLVGIFSSVTNALDGIIIPIWADVEGVITGLSSGKPNIPFKKGWNTTRISLPTPTSVDGFYFSNIVIDGTGEVIWPLLSIFNTNTNYTFNELFLKDNGGVIVSVEDTNKNWIDLATKEDVANVLSVDNKPRIQELAGIDYSSGAEVATGHYCKSSNGARKQVYARQSRGTTPTYSFPGAVQYQLYMVLGYGVEQLIRCDAWLNKATAAPFSWSSSGASGEFAAYHYLDPSQADLRIATGTPYSIIAFYTKING